MKQWEPSYVKVENIDAGISLKNLWQNMFSSKYLIHEFYAECFQPAQQKTGLFWLQKLG